MATYNISSLQDLQDIAPTHMADDCVLLNDIDASDTEEWNPKDAINFPGVYYGFEPLSHAAAAPAPVPFTGTFDGGGFTISNLYINRGSNFYGPVYTDDISLFGVLDNTATGQFIKDLTLTNFNITGSQYVSSLCTRSLALSDASMSNVNISGTLTCDGGSENYISVGGLVAQNAFATVDDCTVNIVVNVTGGLGADTRVGGAAGRIDGGTWTNVTCISTINLSSIFDVAGVIGGFVGGHIGAGTSLCQYCTCDTTILCTTDTSRITNYLKVGGFTAGYGSGVGGQHSYDACIARGTILCMGDGSLFAGGFVYSPDHNTTQCMAVVDINAPNSVNGFLYIGGFLASGTAQDCIARGNVMMLGNSNTGDVRIGGFAGGGSSGSVRCYSTGKVFQHSNGWGGFQYAGSNSTDCHWDTEASGTTQGWASGTPTGITGQTTAEMKLEATYEAGWDFDTVWEIPEFVQPAVPQSNLTVWLSRTGDYHNFEEGLEDDDSFSLVIPSTNEIRWIKGLEALIVGTSAGEWKIASNKLDTPLSPTAYSAKLQTTYGSARINAVAVNSSLLFVDFVGRKVREVTFTPGEEKYVAPDMTELAEHITKSGIVDMAHQKNPDSILWCVLANGKLLSMAYDREQDVVAWSEHITDGTFLSVCVVPDTAEDFVWVTVTRDNGTFIERFMPRDFGDDVADAFFVDSGLTATSPGNTMSGLSHLEGQVVAVLGDGVEQTEETAGDFTVASGAITLATGNALTTVQAGLPFTYKMQPMRIVLASPQGTSFGSITRVCEIVISFLNSLGATYGNQDGDLYTIDFDDPRWEDEAYITGLFSGDVVVTMSGGFSVNNPIIISGSSPLPCNVRLLIARFEKTGR